MRKIVLATVRHEYGDQYGDGYGDYIRGIIPESEWLEIEDDDLKMYYEYANMHHLEVIELALGKNTTNPNHSKENIRQWYADYMEKKRKKIKADRKKNERAEATRKAKAEEAKKKRLLKLAEELKVSINLEE